jgi:hypothetical protein
VERRPDAQDRRVSLICLTPAGSEKLRNIRPHHHENVSRRMHVLSPEEVQKLRDLLHMLHQSLEDGLDSGRSTVHSPTADKVARNGHGAAAVKQTVQHAAKALRGGTSQPHIDHTHDREHA